LVPEFLRELHNELVESWSQILNAPALMSSTSSPLAASQRGSWL